MLYHTKFGCKRMISSEDNYYTIPFEMDWALDIKTWSEESNDTPAHAEALPY